MHTHNSYIIYSLKDWDTLYISCIMILSILKMQCHPLRVPAKCKAVLLNQENRFASPLKSTRKKIGRTISRSIIFAGNISEPLEAPSGPPMTLSLHHRFVIHRLEIPPWADAVKWLVSLPRISFPACLHPCPHLVSRVSSRNSRALSTSQRNSRYICQRCARLCTSSLRRKFPEEEWWIFPRQRDVGVF